MALTVSSIVGNVSGFIGNDKYINLSPSMKEAVKQLNGTMFMGANIKVLFSFGFGNNK